MHGLRERMLARVIAGVPSLLLRMVRSFSVGWTQICHFDCSGKYVLLGVVSFGSGCATEHPGVYARVQGFLPWIKNIIADGEC